MIYPDSSGKFDHGDESPFVVIIVKSDKEEESDD